MNLLDGVDIAEFAEDERETVLSISEQFDQLYQVIKESPISDSAKTALAHKVLQSLQSKSVSTIPPVNFTTNEMWSLLDTAIKTDMSVTEMFRILAQHKGIEPGVIDKWAKKAYQTAIYPQIRVVLREAIENFYRYAIPADLPEDQWDLKVAAVCIYQPLDIKTLSKLSNLSAVIREVRKMAHQVKNEALLARLVSNETAKSEEKDKEILTLKVKLAKAEGKPSRDALIIELHNAGMADAELSKLFDVSLRTITRTIKA